MRKIATILLFVFFLSFAPLAFASSSYVLPYPSTMPGGIAYKLHLVWEKILAYWSFGDFAQFHYNLNEADKYLVEAKTLFEYQQYLLGDSALKKSDSYFEKTLPLLQTAKSHGKNVDANIQLLHYAALKHIEVLQAMQLTNPKEFTWKAEKAPSSTVTIFIDIRNSIEIRSHYL